MTVAHSQPLTRDTDALEALRLVLESIDDLWPVQWHNRKSNTTMAASQGYIVETPVGGPTAIAQTGNGSGQLPLRERTRQWQLLLHAPLDSGLDYVSQFALIEHALRQAPITIGDDDDDGPIPIRVDDVSLRSPRPPTRGVAYETVPIVVLYRFTAS